MSLKLTHDSVAYRAPQNLGRSQFLFALRNQKLYEREALH